MNLFETIIFYIFIVTGAFNMLHLGFYLIGANIYDIKQFKRQSRQPKRKRNRLQPLVTVVIPAHNEELVIERCLESIRKNTYRKVEVIVHDDRSTDTTASIVRRYQRQYPHMALRLISRRHQSGKASGVNYAIKKYAQGELIMTLDADCVLHKRALKRAVDYFVDPNVVGVAANVRIMDGTSILTLLQKFEHMIGYRSKKFYTLSNSEFIVGGVASTYRRDVLNRVKLYDTDTITEDIGLSMKIVASSPKHQRIVYAADVVAATEGVESFKGLLRQRYRWKMGMLQNLVKYRHLAGKVNKQQSLSLTLYRLPVAFLGEVLLLIQPLVLLYAIYLSFTYQTFGLFVGAYMTITLYVLWTIWPDEHSNTTHKLLMSFYAPVMYFIFYIMDFVQTVAVIRCLANPRQILRKTNDNGSWVSPQRQGKQQASFS